MADWGFALQSEDLMRLAYVIVSRSGQPHPFNNGMAGCGWMEGFRKRHPKITLRTPQALSYCRAAMANKSIVGDFFAKLGALYGCLSLIAKPMQVFNIDETGISIVHKPGKVICDLGRKRVFAYYCRKGTNTHCCILRVCEWSCTATIYYLPQKESST